MGNSLGILYISICVMFGMGLFLLWLVLTGYTVRDLFARAILTLAGHLRTAPDPWLESALRSAFAEFDRELAVLLHDRRYPAHPAGPARPGNPQSDPS